MRYLLLCILVLSLPARSAEIAGVRLEDTVTVAGQRLQLNGIGLRSRFVFDVYVAGLYLPERTQSADSALAMPGAKRMTLVMLRDVPGDQLAGSLMDGLKETSTEAELAAVKAQVDGLLATMQRIGEAKKGMAIDLEYAPGAGTAIKVNGASQGPALPDEAFWRALLRVWLGERPVQADLKKRLLGGN